MELGKYKIKQEIKERVEAIEQRITRIARGKDSLKKSCLRVFMLEISYGITFTS